MEKIEKKTILIFALSRKPWIGGIYYRKNIINLLLKNEDITKKFNITILVNKKNANIFDCFKKEISIVECDDNTDVLKAIAVGIKCYFKYSIKYVFPIKPYFFFRLIGITPVSWIADFQHCYYPEFFSEDEVNKRNKDFSIIAKASNPLVLSSYDSKNDLERFFTKNRHNVHVVHFTSCIEEEVDRINYDSARSVLEKHGLKSNQYIAICNQFWKHKNHRTVFEAISILKEDSCLENIKFVFTGELSDRRNVEYIDELKNYIKTNKLEKYIVVTGFIDRLEQLTLMKHAKFIIQPSLFEGWGTVVEDAKKLNKKMILSNIPVHIEQANENCVFFDSLKKEDLVDKIKLLLSSNLDVRKCEDKTEEYSKSMSEVFK